MQGIMWSLTGVMSTGHDMLTQPPPRGSLHTPSRDEEFLYRPASRPATRPASHPASRPEHYSASHRSAHPPRCACLTTEALALHGVAWRVEPSTAEHKRSVSI